MRVLVTGDRHWTDDAFVYRVLDRLHEMAGDDMIVIQGGAKGADKAAACWAADRNVRCMEFPADWARFGKGAGPIRNKQMLVEAEPELVVAFHDAITSSKGTADMVRQAEEAGVQTWLLGHPDKFFDGGQDAD